MKTGERERGTVAHGGAWWRVAAATGRNDERESCGEERERERNRRSARFPGGWFVYPVVNDKVRRSKTLSDKFPVMFGSDLVMVSVRFEFYAVVSAEFWSKDGSTRFDSVKPSQLSQLGPDLVRFGFSLDRVLFGQIC
ncbi:hypothetical protein Hdeb2414_s0001g00029091 [Helianthus debilis subsp. tardiflorus]